MHIPRIKKCVSLLLKLPEGLLIRTKMQTQMRADDLCCLLPPFFGYQPAACRSLEVLIMPTSVLFFWLFKLCNKLYRSFISLSRYCRHMCYYLCIQTENKFSPAFPSKSSCLYVKFCILLTQCALSNCQPIAVKLLV